MTPSEYQKLAARTDVDRLSNVIWRMNQEPKGGFLLHFPLGLMGEVGELVQEKVDRQLLIELIETVEKRLALLGTIANAAPFIGLLGTAYLHLAWVGFTDFAPWMATVACIPLLIAALRWA